MQSFFKTTNSGKFLIKDSLAHKNLRLAHLEHIAQEANADSQKLKREEHQILLCTMQNRVVLLHSNPHLGKVFMYELDPNNVYRY